MDSENSLSDVHVNVGHTMVQQEVQLQPSTWCGFVIVGDNLDRNIKPRHQTLQSRTVSLHCFNSYAVKDRCDFSAFEDAQPPPDLSLCDVNQLLPQDGDVQKLIKVAAILVGRILVKFMPGFSEFKSLVIDHIDQSYSSEMAQMSCVVSL